VAPTVVYIKIKNVSGQRSSKQGESRNIKRDRKDKQKGNVYRRLCSHKLKLWADLELSLDDNSFGKPCCFRDLAESL
jgi:hypothetical protein